MANVDSQPIGEEFARKLSTRVSELEKNIEYYTGHVTLLEKQISRCIQNEKNTATALVRLESNYTSLCNYTKSLEDYCLELDLGSRKKHLLLTGIPETEEEDRGAARAASNDNENDPPDNEGEGGSPNPTHELVLTTLSNIHDTILFDDIDVTYRIGRKKGPNPRPILVKFVRESLRNEISKKRRLLRGSDETHGTFINEDLPQKISQQRADLRSIVANAKQKNVVAQSFGDRITVDNVPYTYKDISSLPPGLKLEDAKTILTPKGLAFQGPHSFLSNFFRATVKFNGRVFSTSEHAYQFERAQFLGRHSKAAEILTVITPQEAKRIGNRIGPAREWDMCKVDRLKSITEAKFNQNHHLREKLVSTGSTQLIEAAHDSFWGAGVPLNARKIKDGTWTGRNVFGVILNDVRTEMRREIAAIAAKRQQQQQASPRQDSNHNNTGAGHQVQPTASPVPTPNTARPKQPPPPPHLLRLPPLILGNHNLNSPTIIPLPHNNKSSKSPRPCRKAEDLSLSKPIPLIGLLFLTCLSGLLVTTCPLPPPCHYHHHHLYNRQLDTHNHCPAMVTLHTHTIPTLCHTIHLYLPGHYLLLQPDRDTGLITIST